jgi:hypothetical protein
MKDLRSEKREEEDGGLDEERKVEGDKRIKIKKDK